MEIISFHSYKGGACRSTTCFNTIPFLAQQMGASSDQPIILIEADLDSVGITKLLITPEEEKAYFSDYSSREFFYGDMGSTRGVIEDFSTHINMKRYMPVGNRFGLEDNGAVLFLGSKAGGATSPEAISRVNMDTLTSYLEFLEDNGGKNPCALVFDCAAGSQATAVQANKIATTIVTCMRPTKQFREGTYDYYTSDFEEFVVKKRMYDCKIIILPTAVAPALAGAQNSLRATAIEETKRKTMELKEFYEDKGTINSCQITVDPSLVIGDKMFGIPEVTSLKFQESVLYIEQQEKIKKGFYMQDEEVYAISCYTALAQAISGDENQ